jgi:hypothetical protein
MTVETSAATSLSSTDKALIAEIAPPMLIKLREDGLAKGAYVGGGLLLCLSVLSLSQSQLNRLDPTSPSSWHSYFNGICLFVGLVGFLLPFFFRRRNVAVEIRYRRQHGKWRWER